MMLHFQYVIPYIHRLQNVTLIAILYSDVTEPVKLNIIYTYLIEGGARKTGPPSRRPTWV